MINLSHSSFAICAHSPIIRNIMKLKSTACTIYENQMNYLTHNFNLGLNAQ